MSEPRSLSQRLSGLASDRPSAPHDLIVEGQRQRMLRAVADLVAEHGYRKTTIEAIAKTARVALSTFYEHFKDKEACLLAAFDATVAEARRVCGELVDGEAAWPEQIAAGLQALVELVVSQPARARLCLVEAQAAGPAGLTRYQEMLESVAPKLRDGRELTAREAPLPDGLEVAIAGGLAWLVHQRLVSDRVAELPALLPEMLQVTLTPYVGEIEAGRVAAEAPAPIAV